LPNAYAKTLKKSVTITPGHYLEVMGKGMEEGIDWFVFDGYMDFLSQDELSDWVRRVNLPVVADVGSEPIYGLENYEGLQVQGNYTREEYVNFAHERGGYAFKPVSDTSVVGNNLPYDGFIAYATPRLGDRESGFDGNKIHIDTEDVPFINPTHDLRTGPALSMVVFTKKGERLTQESLWEAIMDRREVAVQEQGTMMGPANYRHALDLLLLDRVWPEEYFGDRIRLRTFVEDYTLRVVITNTYSHSVSGTLEMTLPEELKVDGEMNMVVQLPAGGEKEFIFQLKPQAGAMNDANPIALSYKWEGKEKRALAMLELPRFISAHQVLYGLAPTVTYPVSIHNFSDENSFPVNVEVLRKDNGRVVYRTSSECIAPTGKFQDLSFELKLPAGSYNVKVSALGLENISQLGVGATGTPKGTATLSEVDLNDDGVNEYRMENDSVQVTLLTTGARVIEYIVKSRNDNVFFKLWPEKALDDRRAYRYRGYYPFGGFEDFLGQGSMETHKIYNAEIVKSEGDFVQVKMVSDYFGNRIEKIFTLYGNSPLVEVRFALTFINPEANVLGPQPIIALGEKHFTEDRFYTPTQEGLKEWVMDPKSTYGRVLYMKEGWNAGYDTEADVSFVGAYPVTEPLYLHMWMNLRRNRDANYDYLEFQPWTPIYQKTTMYFTYYMWGEGGSYENGVQALRDRNLISVMPESMYKNAPK
jgi:hypothetical protein